MVKEDSYLACISGPAAVRAESWKEKTAPLREHNSISEDVDKPIRKTGSTESIQQRNPLIAKIPSDSTTQCSADFSSFHLFRRARASSGKAIIRDALLWGYGSVRGAIIYRETMKQLNAARTLTQQAPKLSPSHPQPSPGSRATTNERGKNYSARSVKRKRLSGSSASSRKRS